MYVYNLRLSTTEERTVAMTEPILIVLGTLAGAIFLFAWGRPRADIVAILVLLALMLSQVLTPQESLAGFGDPVVILIAAIFIVGEALVNTGVTQRMGEAVLRVGGGSETKLIALIMMLAGGLGAFMSSSAIVAMFIPVVLAISNKTGLNRKRMLMPLAVAATISGMMTLIASTPNMIIENILRQQGLAQFSFFSWTPFGLAILAVGIAFMLMGRSLLSKQLKSQDAKTDAPSVYDLLYSYGLASHWHRLRVPAGSSLIHCSVAELQELYDRFGVVVVGVERYVNGKANFLPALQELVFDEDDAIFVVIEEEQQALQFIETQQLIKLPRLDDRQRQEALQGFGAAEIMLAPESKLIGKTPSELEFRTRYKANMLAIRHRGEPLTTNLVNQPLDFGDTLLIAGGWEDILRLWEDREDFILLTLPKEYQERLPARKKAPIAVAIVVIMVVVMAFGLIPNSAAALLASLAMIVTGCVKLDKIYQIISWKTVVLIAGLLPLATALTKTGATKMMAHGLVAALGSLGPIAMLVVLFIVTSLVGLFLSNSATAMLTAPVAIQAAQALHVSPQAFAMTVSIACSAAYVTPVSSAVNMLVMEPGGYTFGSYVKVGLPLLLLTMLVTVGLVTVIYPL
ncbi:MAG: SLC13 family permease [Pseudanabaena sp.]|nr:MAG: SLC13 family permease [Pseudanabaena sp.]